MRRIAKTPNVGQQTAKALRSNAHDLPSQMPQQSKGKHLVQFYETEDFLLTILCDFIEQGLDAGEACLLFVTPIHQERLEAWLQARGLDLASLRARGAYRFWDADEILAQILVDGMPEQQRFTEVVGKLLAHEAQDGRQLRVFGEMVVQLWTQGNPTASIRLEELWNELSQTALPFLLLCAYPMDIFAGEAYEERFTAIWQQHSHALPAEPYSTLTSEKERLHAISLLQQKAALLEAEIAKHREAEERLREQGRLASLQMDVSAALTAGGVLRDVLTECAGALVRHLDAAFARVWTLNETTQVLELQASAGMYTHLDGGHARVPLGAFKIGRIAETCKPHLTNAVIGDPAVSDQAWATREGMIAFAGYPLLLENRVMGVMALFARHELTEIALEGMASVANAIALGIERHRAEEALRQSVALRYQEQQQLQIALAASQTGTFRWNPSTGIFLAFDENLKRLFGFAPDESVRVTEDFLARVHPDDAPAILPAVEHAQQQGADFAMEYRVVHPDGSIHWLYDRAKMEYDAQGNPTYLVGACTDITGRKQMESALHESAERLRFMAESMPQKIFTATPTGEIDYFNPQWMEFTGLSFEEIRDWGWIQFVHPEDVEENVRRWQHSIATGEPFALEHRFRRADGVYRWHLSRAIPMRDAQGQLTMWIGSNTDIDEQKQLDVRKDDFFSMASHDLRTPLTAMKGNLQLAERRLKQMLATPDMPPERTRQLLEELALLVGRAQRQTEVQYRLIRDFLDVSRIQAGKLELSLDTCDLVALVYEMVRDHQASALTRTITLSLPETREPVAVLADADRLGQVIGNYLTNALKYSAAPAPVTVGLNVEGNNARIWVRDQGPGLSQEQQLRIWERFYQAPGVAVQSGAGQGMGLGLHICQILIARQNGAVGVESRLGAGSTFWFTLPLLETP